MAKPAQPYPRSSLTSILQAIGRPDLHLPVSRTPGVLLAIIAASASMYGVVMGTFLLDGPGRWLFMVFGAIKLPCLLLITAALCLPVWFVLHTVVGLRDDFGRSVRAVLSGQAALAVSLVSMSPLVRVAYSSGIEHSSAQLFNAALFAVATAIGHVVMLRHHRRLTRGADTLRKRKQAFMLWAWLVSYALVGVQMAWIMRPYIGVPGMPATFFRQDAVTNAYVYFARIIFGG